MSSAKKKTKMSGAARSSLPVSKISKGTTDRSMKRAAESELFGISRLEFAKRARYRDTSGNMYGVAKKRDILYKKYLKSHLIDPLQDDSDDDDDDDQLAGGEALSYTGLPEQQSERGRSLMYLKQPLGRKSARIPRGNVRLLDIDTKHLYTARISLMLKRPRSKTGHAILSNIVDNGRLEDTSEFHV